MNATAVFPTYEQHRITMSQERVGVQSDRESDCESPRREGSWFRFVPPYKYHTPARDNPDEIASKLYLLGLLWGDVPPILVSAWSGDDEA